MERRLSEPRPEYLVLGLLKPGPDHGYRLYQTFERHLGTVWHLSQPQFYATLKRLAAKGWIAESPRAETSGRQNYALTEAGEQRFMQWLASDCVSSARVIRLEFISRLFFADFLGAPPSGQLVRSQIIAVQNEIIKHHGLLSRLPPSDKYNAMSLDFRLSQLTA
ncbi:MAG: PadR family transcriptional regulator, partial [Spirochaetes bacterium]|nr:PadR family transcriptional regulator [Spirochaetota bacterium]